MEVVELEQGCGRFVELFTVQIPLGIHLIPDVEIHQLIHQITQLLKRDVSLRARVWIDV